MIRSDLRHMLLHYSWIKPQAFSSDEYRSRRQALSRRRYARFGEGFGLAGGDGVRR